MCSTKCSARSCSEDADLQRGRSERQISPPDQLSRTRTKAFSLGLLLQFKLNHRVIDDNRMPVLFSSASHDTWLTGSTNDAEALMMPAKNEALGVCGEGIGLKVEPS